MSDRKSLREMLRDTVHISEGIRLSREAGVEEPARFFWEAREACYAQAQLGRRELDFPMGPPCTTQGEWDRLLKVREHVVLRLQTEGCTARGHPDSFSEGTVWNEWTLEHDPAEVQHRIRIRW